MGIPAASMVPIVPVRPSLSSSKLVCPSNPNVFAIHLGLDDLLKIAYTIKATTNKLNMVRLRVSFFHVRARRRRDVSIDPIGGDDAEKIAFGAADAYGRAVGQPREHSG